MPRKPKGGPDLVAIGRRIRELRGAVRQDDFAPALGIAQGQLSKIERGQLAPSVEVLLRLRERSGKSVDWILTG
jgi:transcriptional regulator with XRE-family HTH domain